MNLRTLGRTGLHVSEIGFGAWGIGGTSPITGTGYGPVDDVTSLAALERAFDLGCNFIDTADSYGVGHSEEVLGRFLAGRRDRVILATKFSHWPEFDATGHKISLPPSEANVRRYLEASLRRLGTDYVDLYQWHSCRLDLALEHDLNGTLEKLRAEGKIRFAGISVYGVTHLEQMAAGAFGPVFDVLQESVNVTTLRFEPALAAAAAAGIGVVAREPLGNGMLAGKDKPEDLTAAPKHARATRDPVQARIRAEFAAKLRERLERPDRTLVQSLIRYTLQVSGVSTVIPGCKTLTQVDENFGASVAPALTPEEIAFVHACHAEAEREHGRISPYAIAGFFGT